MHRDLNAPRPDLTPWPPKNVPVAVAGLRWRTAPDHLKEYDDYGATHVAFVLQPQLLDNSTNESKFIVVRWSHIKALHAALAPTWDLSGALGYTDAMASKLSEGKTFALSWGSCLDSKVAERRLSGIATFLEMVLKEPKLRANANIKSFHAHGQARAAAWGADALGAATTNTSPLAVTDNAACATTVTTTTPTTTTSTITRGSPAASGANAATTTPTTTTSTTISSSVVTTIPSAQPAPLKRAASTQMKNQRSKGCAAPFLRRSAVRALLTVGGPTLAALGIPLPCARENQENVGDVTQLFFCGQ